MLKIELEQIILPQENVLCSFTNVALFEEKIVELGIFGYCDAFLESLFYFVSVF